ncbi:MAG: YHYH protein [Bacteroidota bacterium]
MKNIGYFLLIASISYWSCHSHKKGVVIDNAGHADHLGNYTIRDTDYGTETTVHIENGRRIITTNALPNHDTGSFPNQGNPNAIRAQNQTYQFPLTPIFTGESKWVREPGVAINGIKFEPETAEVVRCVSGENYRVEAMQTLIDLGLDFNHAHVQPTGAYHYHGTPTGIVNASDSEKDLIHIGFARDGHLMYYSKSGAYKPSYKMIDTDREGTDCVYENPHQRKEFSIQGSVPDGSFKPDWEYIPGLGDLDECNGTTIDGEYVYLVTDDYPYVGRCLMGEFEEERRPRGPRPPHRRRGE